MRAQVAHRFSPWALVRARCPRCRQGHIFSGQITMNEHCPVCGLRFGREQGYFMGAMYFSYLLSIPPLVLALLAVSFLFPGVAWEWRVLLAGVLLLPAVPGLFRYSRVLWIHLERWACPE